MSFHLCQLHRCCCQPLVPKLLPSVTARIQSVLRPCHASHSDIATLGHSQNPVSTQALSRLSFRHCYSRSQPESSQHSGPVTPLAPTVLPSVTARIQSALRPCHAARTDIAALGHSQNLVSTLALSCNSSPHCYPRSQPESSQYSGPVMPFVPILLHSVTARIQSALRPCHAARPHIATLGHSQNPVSTQVLSHRLSGHCYPQSQPESSHHSGPAARGPRCKTPDRW